MKTATLLLVALLAGPTLLASPELAVAGGKNNCHWVKITRRVWSNGGPHWVTKKVKRCDYHHN